MADVAHRLAEALRMLEAAARAYRRHMPGAPDHIAHALTKGIEASETALAAYEAEQARPRARVSEQEPEWFACGQGRVDRDAPIGCGEYFYFKQAYRCVDCDVVFCRRCARAHFAESKEASRG